MAPWKDKIKKWAINFGRRTYEYVWQKNYYRILLVFFILYCLIAAIIVWGLERNHLMPFIDALFMASSAATNTGLTTFDTSVMNVGSQVFLAWLSISGNFVTHSVILVQIRKLAYERAINERAKKLGKSREELIDKASDLDLELSSLRIISIIVPIYCLFFYFFGSLFTICALISSQSARQPIEDRNLSFVWVGTMLSINMFTNTGMSPINDSLISLHQNTVVIFIMGLLTFAGNTAFPFLLRALLWSMFKLLPRWEVFSTLKVTLHHLLKFPRLYYTSLYSSSLTLWIVVFFFTINGFQYFMNIGVEWNQPVYYNYSTQEKLVAAWATASFTRHTGANCVNVGSFQPVTKWIIIVFMYAAPIMIRAPIEASNVVEDPEPPPNLDDMKLSRHSFMLTRPSLYVVASTPSRASMALPSRSSISMRRTSMALGSQSLRVSSSNSSHTMNKTAPKIVADKLQDDPQILEDTTLERTKSTDRQPPSDGTTELTEIKKRDKKSKSQSKSKSKDTLSSTSSSSSHENIVIYDEESEREIVPDGENRDAPSDIWFKPAKISPDVKGQTKALAAEDFTFFFIFVIILCIAEQSKFDNDAFTIFNVLFESVSAIGTNGMSFGYPGVNSALSTAFSIVGKLCIIALMIFGRLRFVPTSDLDNSIKLPKILNKELPSTRAAMELTPEEAKAVREEGNKPKTP